MPSRSKHPCNMPGCGVLVLDGRYCKGHQAASVDTKRQYEQYRGSAASRGYDRTWQAVRKEFLGEHPCCEDCIEERPPRATAATEAHHLAKVAGHPELRLVMENLRALCHECHSARTARGE